MLKAAPGVKGTVCCSGELNPALSRERAGNFDAAGTTIVGEPIGPEAATEIPPGVADAGTCATKVAWLVAVARVVAVPTGSAVFTGTPVGAVVGVLLGCALGGMVSLGTLVAVEAGGVFVAAGEVTVDVRAGCVAVAARVGRVADGATAGLVLVGIAFVLVLTAACVRRGVAVRAGVPLGRAAVALGGTAVGRDSVGCAGATLGRGVLVDGATLDFGLGVEVASGRRVVAVGAGSAMCVTRAAAVGRRVAGAATVG